jgi:endonuclease YncB( thermonuclease family)
LALLLASARLHAQDGARVDTGVDWEASVSYVVDGDSIWVRAAAGGRRVRLRLDGIDAPEICQRFGREARQALQAKLLNQRVRVTVWTYDRYGRAIARVTRVDDGVDAAAQMVSEGWAWTDQFRGRPGKYQRQQDAAQRQRIGLFADRAPELPRDFRQRHGPCGMH